MLNISHFMIDFNNKLCYYFNMATEFQHKVYEKLKLVPSGFVTTYKQLAAALNTKACRAVGNALRNNPYAPVVPCHRVVMSNGNIGGFNGRKQGEEIQHKIELLKAEGVKVKDNRIMDFEKRLFRF
jgi:methylated-DNA-[protein]-cysteine S-methyltransferase